MLLISQLVSLWQRRLAHVRAIAHGPSPLTSDQWLWRVRERILSFLVTRYSDPITARREQALTDLVEPTLDPCLFEVEPVDAPPRSRQHLGESLRAIHHSNHEAWRARRGRWLIF